ncbi:MAG: ABC transporter substrate-binding protein [Actinobacteria bacterium]|nr:ABC transporter substrate-binding protein [Actinomycetota bacterium]
MAAIIRLSTILVLAAALAAFAGCGDDKEDTSDEKGGTSGIPASIAAEKDDAVAALVPAAIADKGELTVALDATYPPNEFFDDDGKTIVGMDADLAKLIGDVMGLDAKLENVTFDAILPGLAAGKYDIAMSSFTDTKEREKTVDMVTYFSAGTKFYTTTAEPVEVSGLADLCGKTVAVQKGTTQADDAEAQSKKCEADGQQPVDAKVFTGQDQVNLALTSGRADLAFADAPTVVYAVQQSDGKLKETGEQYNEAPYGVAVNKDSGLTEAVLAAVKALQSGGQYTAVLERWSQSDGAIDEPKINDGIE